MGKQSDITLKLDSSRVNKAFDEMTRQAKLLGKMIESPEKRMREFGKEQAKVLGLSERMNIEGHERIGILKEQQRELDKQIRAEKQLTAEMDKQSRTRRQGQQRGGFLTSGRAGAAVAGSIYAIDDALAVAGTQGSRGV